MPTAPDRLSGVLPIDKPAGPSSRMVVNQIQQVVYPEKIGHAGTLDPLASGVLVVCLGSATRLIQYVQRLPKEYLAEFRLGITSPTDDLEGEITPLAGDGPIPTHQSILSVLPQFLGPQQQVPPNFSAIRVNGKRAYQLARKDKQVALTPRTIEIHELDLVEFHYPRLLLRTVCGSGTYIRALGRDIAQALNTAAVMTSLVRTRIGPFGQAAASSPAELNSRTEIQQRLLDTSAAVTVLPRLELDNTLCRNLLQGKVLPAHHYTGPPAPEIAVCDHHGRLISILESRGPTLHPKLNLFSQNEPLG